MKKYISFLLFLIVLVSSNKLFALYPDADPYPYKKNLINTYIGISFASLVSESLGTYPGNSKGTGSNKDRYQALWNPSHLFNAYNSSINLGIRFADNKNIFLNNLRFEAQYINAMNQYAIIVNASKMKESDYTTKNPNAGFERLINGAALMIFYDIRSWSQVIYPYIGVGVGIGTFQYTDVDTQEYYNGAGERYNASKRMPFGEATIGIAYETKIIKSAFFFEYKIMTTFSKITLNPTGELSGYNNVKFDGISNAKPGTVNANGIGTDNGNPIESEMPTEAQTHPRDIRFIQHGISFGIRFYLS